MRPEGGEVVPVQLGRQPERVRQLAEALERGALLAGLAGHGHQRAGVARQGVGIDDHAGTLPQVHILVLTDRDWTHPQGGGTGANLYGQVSRWLAWGHRVRSWPAAYDGSVAH